MSAPRASSPESGLDPDSYTAQRLKHATPVHLHLTTRRLFIGPIPEGWLNSHRRQWYRHHLHINYSSKKAAFSVDSNVDARTRQITGLDGPSTTATFVPSFPQPRDVSKDSSNVSGEETEDDTGGQSTQKIIPGRRRNSGDDNRSQQHISALDDEAEGIPAPVPLASSRSKTTKSQKTQSFVTARETLSSQRDEEENDLDGVQDEADHDTGGPSPSTPYRDSASNLGSQFSLSRKASKDTRSEPDSSTGLVMKPDQSLSLRRDGNELPPSSTEIQSTTKALEQDRKKVNPGFVRFNVPDSETEAEQDLRLQAAQVSKRRSLRQRRKGQANGEIIKLAKMLVRMEMTPSEVPKDYDENESVKIETKVVEKWREYVVVCRESSNSSQSSHLALQFYKTRVIEATQQVGVKKRFAHEIYLIPKTTFANLYSSLDKSLVVWHPTKHGNRICIIKPSSAAAGVEWHTFLRTVLGWHRPNVLHVSVPDLNLTLELENPFQELESQREQIDNADDLDETVLLRTVIKEQAVAGNIIRRCMGMLSNNSEWADILENWSKVEKMGLAWRRYDRLEWVHGINEQKMYGTVAMARTHELELRPKQHYPTSVQNKEGHDKAEMEEPVPMEGFLVRLTSQRGRDQRLGKMFYKRLYYSTHNQYLCFCRPAKAFPPPPPTLLSAIDDEIPTSEQILDGIPLTYSVEPFRLQHGQIGWLRDSTPASRRSHDLKAYKEAERQVNTLLDAEGFINLCDVTDVRSFVRGAQQVDENLDEGSEVDFDEDVDDTTRNDGVVEAIDEKRTLQLSLENGLVIRLEAYNEKTKKEWIKGLRRLMRYWKLRAAADSDLLKSVRQSNLKQLDIDEQMEAIIGQFARKWEVSKTMASSELYNICRISCCRTISISGILFYKPRLHATFKRLFVILTHGHLLIFEHSSRSASGAQRAHIQHERHSVINLKDSYVYSGLITEGDLLYQNQSFETHQTVLGSHTLPRVFVEDGWTANDEDTMTCFVVWHGTRKGFFRSVADKADQVTGLRVKRVNQLGKPGRGMVFKTRSRAERDQWVLSISMEIERLQQAEEVRVTV